MLVAMKWLVSILAILFLTNVNIPKDSGFFVVCEGSLNQEIFLIKVIDKPLPQKCRKLSKKYRYHTYTHKILFFFRESREFFLNFEILQSC